MARFDELSIKDAVTGDSAGVCCGGLDVNVQDQTTKTGDLFFSQVLGVTGTLAIDAVINTYSFTASTGHGIIVGDQLVIYDTASDRLYIGNVLAVATDVITMDTPLNYSYPAATASIGRSTREMNVDGSSTRQTFAIEPPVAIEIDITRIMFQIVCTGAPSMNTFGDISGGLVRGLVLRSVDGINVNYFNVKTNGELVNLMYDVNFYEATGPQGVNGIGGRLTYGGSSKHGVVIRLGQGDTLEAIVQDDLTGLLSMRMIATFHEVV